MVDTVNASCHQSICFNKVLVLSASVNAQGRHHVKCCRLFLVSSDFSVLGSRPNSHEFSTIGSRAMTRTVLSSLYGDLPGAPSGNRTRVVDERSNSSIEFS